MRLFHHHKDLKNISPFISIGGLLINISSSFSNSFGAEQSLLMRLHSFLQACSVSKKSYTVLLLTGPLLMAIQVVSGLVLL